MVGQGGKSGRFGWFAAALVLGLLVQVAVGAAEKQGPRIYVHESRFDFGNVDQGAVLEHIFEIRNLGDEVLEIGRIQPA